MPCRELCKGRAGRESGGVVGARLRNNGRAALARSRGLRRPGRLSPSSRGGSMPRAAAGRGARLPAARSRPCQIAYGLPWPISRHARVRLACLPVGSSGLAQQGSLAAAARRACWSPRVVPEGLLPAGDLDLTLGGDAPRLAVPGPVI